jgi:hypothetical protein
MSGVRVPLRPFLGKSQAKPKLDKSRQTPGKLGVFSFLSRMRLSQQGTFQDRSSHRRGLTFGLTLGYPISRLRDRDRFARLASSAPWRSPRYAHRFLPQHGKAAFSRNLSPLMLGEQLLLYGDLARRFVPGKALKLRFAVITKTKEPKVQILDAEFEAERLERTKAVFKAVWSAVQAGHFYYPSPSPMTCSCCGYRSQCAVWRG